MFDADAYLKALEPPAIRLGGKVYQGRVLSVDEFMPYAGQLQAIVDREVDLAGAMNIVTAFVDDVFPRPWYWPRPLPAWFGLHRALRALPPAALAEALQDFLRCQVRALTGKEPEPVEVAGSQPDPPRTS